MKTCNVETKLCLKVQLDWIFFIKVIISDGSGRIRSIYIMRAREGGQRRGEGWGGDGERREGESHHHNDCSRQVSSTLRPPKPSLLI